MRNTIEIYGTMGPACSEKETLIAMFQEGMTGMRLNLSHITLAQARDQIQTFHDAAKTCGIEPKLLVDLQGPELRIASLQEEIILATGAECVLGEGGVPIPELVMPYLMPGQKILLDDGKILLEVKEDIHLAKVLRGGKLSGRKSIALEGCEIPVPTLTQQDIDNLKEAPAYGVTGVMQPFVRNQEDLNIVRKTMDQYGGQEIALFAKIENQNGIRHLEEFFAVADEIVIARGDLGNSMPLWELPGVQKSISAKCKKADMPFMVVTQMLASMENRAVPTRAEVSDIYNAVLDGAASVMVTGETAVGAYPVEVIRYLYRTAQEAVKMR